MGAVLQFDARAAGEGVTPKRLILIAVLAASLGTTAAYAEEEKSPKGTAGSQAAQAYEAEFGARRPTCRITPRPHGKVQDIRWTQGPDDLPIGETADHYTDLNLIVTTTGYHSGDCIKVTFRAEDGRDIAEGFAEIVLTGRVGKDGRLRLERPLRSYTLILSDPEG